MVIPRYRIGSPIQLALIFLFSALSTSATERPNIVFILLDDLSHYGVSAYGAEELNSTQGFFDPVPVATPEIDRLAEEGVLAK